MTRFLTFAGAMALGAALVLPAWADNLVMGIKLVPTSMDPHFRLAGENESGLTNLYARVIAETPEKKLAPGIAESWKTLDDTTWEIKVRANAKFSDGSPITAEDIAFSIERIPTIENSPGGYIIFTQSIASTQVVDPLTLHIKTKSPYPFLPIDLSRIFVVPKALGMGVKTADFNNLTIKVTSGPFTPTFFQPGDRLEMQANPYWVEGKPHWDKVVVKQISSDPSRVAALLAGDVQAIDEVPIQDLARLRADPKLKVTSAPGMRVMYIAMDTEREVSPFVRDNAGQPMTKNPLQDVRVRKALSYAINREAIIARVLDGAGTPAGNMLPDGVEGTSPNIKPDPYDPERAKKLLKEAGYPDGFQVTLNATNDRYPNDEKVAQAIAQMWTRIGVKTEVGTQPNATFFTQAAKQAFSLMAAQYGASDVSMMYRALIHTFDKERRLGSANRTHQSSPRADVIAREALETMDEDKRNALFAKASEIALREDQVINFLYYPQYIYAARDGLSVTPNVDGRFLADGIRRQGTAGR